MLLDTSYFHPSCLPTRDIQPDSTTRYTFLGGRYVTTEEPRYHTITFTRQIRIDSASNYNDYRAKYERENTSFRIPLPYLHHVSNMMLNSYPEWNDTYHTYRGRAHNVIVGLNGVLASTDPFDADKTTTSLVPAPTPNTYLSGRTCTNALFTGPKEPMTIVDILNSHHASFYNADVDDFLLHPIWNDGVFDRKQRAKIRDVQRTMYGTEIFLYLLEILEELTLDQVMSASTFKPSVRKPKLLGCYEQRMRWTFDRNSPLLKKGCNDKWTEVPTDDIIFSKENILFDEQNGTLIRDATGRYNTAGNDT